MRKACYGGLIDTLPPRTTKLPRKPSAESATVETAPDAIPPEASEADAIAAGSVKDLLNLILEKLDDDQAQDVVQIDLNGLSPLADAIVIASGRSQRHVSAIADHIVRALKDAGRGKAATEGLPQADWVLIDAGDVIVHLFRPEVRAFYNIEKIWSVEPPVRTTAGVGPTPSL
jgi:ribosome-associated protein